MSIFIRSAVILVIFITGSRSLNNTSEVQQCIQVLQSLTIMIKKRSQINIVATYTITLLWHRKVMRIGQEPKYQHNSLFAGVLQSILNILSSASRGS